MTERQTREELVELGRSLFDRGYAAGSSGNMSVRLNDGRILATPSGSSMGRLRPEALSLLDNVGNHLSGDRPSKEMLFHMALYAGNPDCGSVVHLHSTWATMLSCRDDLDIDMPIRPFSPYYVMKVGTLQVIPYYPPGDERIAVEMAEWAGKRNAFLLRNHGPVVTAGCLTDAVDLAEELEETAKIHCLMNGNSGIRYLSDEDVNFLKKR